MAKKTWEQYKAECEAVAKEGITIVGFVAPWKGVTTKLHCHCVLHGDWFTSQITTFRRGVSCPACGEIQSRESRIASSDHVASFLATGKFHPATKFWPIDPLKGKKYWAYSCPTCSQDEYSKAGVCDGVFTAQQTNLKDGKLSCRCSAVPRYTKSQWEYRIKAACEKRGYTFIGWIGDQWGMAHKFSYSCPLHGIKEITPKKLNAGQGCPECANHTQQQCYIHLIGTGRADWDFIKIGIAVNSAKRIREQRGKAALKMESYRVWEFPDTVSCKAAEREILTTLPCGVLTREQMRDGFTETLPVAYLEQVIAIYQKHGGVTPKVSLKR